MKTSAIALAVLVGTLTHFVSSKAFGEDSSSGTAQEVRHAMRSVTPLRQLPDRDSLTVALEKSSFSVASKSLGGKVKGVRVSPKLSVIIIIEDDREADFIRPGEIELLHSWLSFQYAKLRSVATDVPSKPLPQVDEREN